MATTPWLTAFAITSALALSALAQTLTVVSWGGSYGRASQSAILDPFTAETGI